MKTTDQMLTPANGSGYGRLLLTLLLVSALFAGTANAQERRRGEGRNRPEREGTVREQPGRNPSVDRNNPGRNFNRNPNPVRIGRNRENAPVVRNTEGNRNPGVNNRPNRTGNNNRPVVGTANRPAYRPVYGYNRRPVYNAYNPSWRYGYLPRRNSYFYSLPSSYFSISFGGIGYRYWDGVFYRPHNNLFTVIAPPVGIYINVLPVGYRRIMVRDYQYYYYNGTYYDQRQNNYYVVSPPVGAVVESLPAGYETVVIDGETYYTADGAQYKPVVQQSGEIWYEVIKAN